MMFRQVLKGENHTYYIETDTPDYTIVSSYVTEKQARRYGGDPLEGYLESLQKDEHYEQFFPEWQTVRTVFFSKTDDKLDRSSKGRFNVYYATDYGTWESLDFKFKTYSDANAAVKGPLSKIFSEMVVTEDNPNWHEEMKEYSDSLPQTKMPPAPAGLMRNSTPL